MAGSPEFKNISEGTLEKTLKYIPLKPGLVIALALVVLPLVFPTQAAALGGPELPALEEFITEVMNGDGDALRGIYAPGVFAYSIIPQPEKDPAYVSTRMDTLTQFELASRHGSTGLLAHNYLAGDRFSLVEKGQLLYLIYGDGRVEVFGVSRLMRFQASTPNSVKSSFVNLETGDFLSAGQLFLKAYTDPGTVVLQTCISKNGESSWGRLFIIAEPFEEQIVHAWSESKQVTE